MNNNITLLEHDLELYCLLQEIPCFDLFINTAPMNIAQNSDGNELALQGSRYCFPPSAKLATGALLTTTVLVVSYSFSTNCGSPRIREN